MSSHPADSNLSISAVSALEDFRVAWNKLLVAVENGELDHLDDGEFIEFMQDHERLRNQTAQIDHHLVAAVVERDLAAVLCQPSLARVLTSTLRISHAEARQRVAAAAAVGPRRSTLGQQLEPARPLLSAAQREGAVSTDQVAIIANSLTKVDGRGFDPADIEAGEKLLTDDARLFGPEDLRRLAQRVVDGIDPDGVQPDDIVHDRRSFELTRAGDNAWRCAGRLTGLVGATLRAVLDAQARPRAAVPGLPAGPGTGDERTRTQRMHDALGDLAGRGLREGTGAQTTVGAATVIVTIDADDLLRDVRPDQTCDSNAALPGTALASDGSRDQKATGARVGGRQERWRRGTGHGMTSDGTVLSVDDIALMAAEAEIVPSWLTSTGRLIDLGRTRRCASRAQTLAMVARDGGCSFPGCDRPPEWCERHHILAWIDGGATDIDNLTLLCRYHHHNFANRGWTCRMNRDGIPEWTPPRWIDSAQLPIINHRIIARRDAKMHRNNRGRRQKAGLTSLH